MNTDCNLFNCELCDYISKKKYNITRHMMRNHAASNVIPTAQKGMNSSAKSMILSAKGMISSAKGIRVCSEGTLTETAMISCDKCNKTFAKLYNLHKHYEKCKGIINPYQCEKCLKIFKYKNNKYVHRKKCMLVNESISDTISKEEITQQNIEINNTTNNTTNNINNTNNNITNTMHIDNSNNIINQIIVFDPKDMELLNDHITKKELRDMVGTTDFAKVLSDYSIALLRRKENQCVRKTNLASASSAIYVGDNRWEYQTDKYIYPKLLTKIAYNFSDAKENFKIKVLQQLDNFIDDVASEATDCYTSIKDEQKLTRLYRKLFNNVKHLIFNLTKKSAETTSDESVVGV